MIIIKFQSKSMYQKTLLKMRDKTFVDVSEENIASIFRVKE
jgi:hypothetical protein